MPLFGSKKKKKKERGADIEAPEEDGLFMARGSEAVDSEGAPAPSVDSEDNESDPAALTGDDVADLSALEGEAEETAEPDEAAAETPTAAAPEEEKSNADDLLAAFADDDEVSGDLADITKDLDDVPMADLLAELREIRMTLPPEALEHSEDVA